MVTGVCTLALTVVHPVFGRVIFLSQTAALGGIRLIWNVLIVLLDGLDGHLSGLLRVVAVGQRLQHSRVIAVLR